MSGADIVRARTEARLARLRLTEDFAALRLRLSPGEIAREVREQATVTARELRVEAVNGVRRRPLAVAGGIGAIVLIALIPAIRRIAVRGARAWWRNRAQIEQFTEERRSARKDDRP